VVRGLGRCGPFVAFVVCGVVGLGVMPPSGADAPPSYRLRVDTVGYSIPGKTTIGIPVRKGVVAVDPNVIPLRTRLHVPGYGKAVAADVGTAVKGRIIDLWFPTRARARKWGRRTVVITVYR
jgi:3D (Asp-Asp-Asp) domain-containing protein